MTDAEKIKGVCGLVISPTGSVLATRADFDQSGYGGYELADAQRVRVERFLKGAARFRRPRSLITRTGRSSITSGKRRYRIFDGMATSDRRPSPRYCRGGG